MRREADGFAVFAVVVLVMIAAASFASPWAGLAFFLSSTLFPLLAWLTYRSC